MTFNLKDKAYWIRKCKTSSHFPQKLFRYASRLSCWSVVETQLCKAFKKLTNLSLRYKKFMCPLRCLSKWTSQASIRFNNSNDNSLQFQRYIDEGRNPQLYTKDCMEKALNKNEQLKGKIDSYRKFRAHLLEELSQVFPNETMKYRTARGDDLRPSS